MRPHDREQALHRPPLRHLERRFRFRPLDAERGRVLYVDGVEPGYRNLSHWPGNSTPAGLKRDLSTGIALAFAALPPAKQLQLVGEFDIVANNHYDTDGALSAFTVLRPEEALRRADLLLRAAATGDFSTWNGGDALAIDLTVMSLLKHPDSPLAAPLLGIEGADRRHEMGYAWLIDRLPAILDDPFAYSALWAQRHAQVVADIASDDVDVQRFADDELAIVTTRRALTSIGLHHAAGRCYRVLLVRPMDGGTAYRFVYRDESWFDLISHRPLGRAPLEAVVEDLRSRERSGMGRWWCTGIDGPVAAMGFGDPANHGDGFFEDPALELDPPSSLDVAVVVDALRRTWKS